MDIHDISAINKVVDSFFEKEKGVNQIKAKDLMPLFIEANIFDENNKDGLPIRKLLRKLDDNNQLNLMPRLKVERKKTNRYWYFER